MIKTENMEEWFNSTLESYREDAEFIALEAAIDFNEQVIDIMKQKTITRAQLAEKLGVKKSYITRVLNGLPNMTLKTMVSIARALDCNYNVRVSPNVSYFIKDNLNNMVKYADIRVRHDKSADTMHKYSLSGNKDISHTITEDEHIAAAA